MPVALYTAGNCRFAYQLNWSLSVFASAALPDKSLWLDPLKAATEGDGVRVLEHRMRGNSSHQFLLSTQPQISPSQAIRSVKGRC